ncbi:sensor histidine kinase [Actinoplanes sp. NPDC051343]|uniref:sensor histidine kinase n=1 Tax=Actinoplanes sp. NPDC051343 TaxID=3363906 RepID=UPI0037BACEF7
MSAIFIGESHAVVRQRASPARRARAFRSRLDDRRRVRCAGRPRGPDPARPYASELARLATPALAGPPVHLAIDGNLDNLPPAVGAALFRPAQEAVTNARRHARHATRIEIRVAADDTSERAVLLGGVFTAGPNPDRGWSVTATLPRAVSAG